MAAERHEASAPSRARGRALELLVWPEGIARLGVVLCGTLLAAFALGYLPRALDGLGDQARRNSALSYADREVAGGNSILPDQQAAYEARAIIPRTATYRVSTGPHLTKSTDLTLDFVASWLTYFLLPRRPADDARWIVCVGCDTSEYGSRYHVLWQDDVGISIGRLGS